MPIRLLATYCEPNACITIPHTRSERWMQYEIQEDGMKIKVQPGIVGARVNQILAPYGRKIGPDPASINAVCDG